MPFPRRVIIYLREKGIPSSLITIVHVSDPPENKVVGGSYPPKPEGSLPILVIPNDDTGEPTYIRQSIAIMNYIDEVCDNGVQGFPRSPYPMRGADILSRARVTELLSLADECTIAWNPVRTFGSGAGTMSIPEASNEMLRWIKRTLQTIERYIQDEDFTALRQGGKRGPNMAEIILYQFLEFTRDCYGRDMGRGSGEEVVDVYGRRTKEAFPKIEEFFAAFGSRESAKRDPAMGEKANAKTLARMKDWAEGVAF